MLLSSFAAVRSVVYATGFVGFWAWLALGVRAWDSSPLPVWCTVLGMILFVPGALLMGLSIGVFAPQGKGTPAPFDAPRRFVMHGPYRWVRNPMYVGAWTLLTGFALYLRSPAMLAFAGAWVLLAHTFVVLYEEP